MASHVTVNMFIVENQISTLTSVFGDKNGKGACYLKMNLYALQCLIRRFGDMPTRLKTKAICYLLCGATVKILPNKKKKREVKKIETLTKHDHNSNSLQQRMCFYSRPSSEFTFHGNPIELTRQKYRKTHFVIFFH